MGRPRPTEAGVYTPESIAQAVAQKGQNRLAGCPQKETSQSQLAFLLHAARRPARHLPKRKRSAKRYSSMGRVRPNEVGVDTYKSAAQAKGLPGTEWLAGCLAPAKGSRLHPPERM